MLKSKIKSKILHAFTGLLAMAFMLGAPLEVYASESSATEEVPEQLELEIIESTEQGLRAPTPRTMLVDCFILYACTDNGLEVDISTGAAGEASLLGIKDIKVQKKMWYGWKTVASSDGVETTDRASVGCSFIYSGVEEGEQYRISCVHYGTVDTYTETENVTEAFTFYYP